MNYSSVVWRSVLVARIIPSERSIWNVHTDDSHGISRPKRIQHECLETLGIGEHQSIHAKAGACTDDTLNVNKRVHLVTRTSQLSDDY